MTGHLFSPRKYRARIFKRLWSPEIDSKEWIPPVCSLADRYDNPIPTQFLSPIDCLKIPTRSTSSAMDHNLDLDTFLWRIMSSICELILIFFYTTKQNWKEICKCLDTIWSSLVYLTKMCRS